MTQPADRSTAICVLGMHRSGTSVLARLLNILEVELGAPDDLMAAGDDNPRGYWEHEGIVAINEDILRLFDADWSHPPQWLEDWVDDPRLGAIQSRVCALIESNFSRWRRWGWKDPRTCLTLPLWRRWVPGCRFIFGVRHPGDVARSLIRRNGFSMARAMWLWAQYNRQALRGSEGADRCVVRYEQAMQNPLRVFDHLGVFLDRRELTSQDDLRQQVCAFIDPRLQHHACEEFRGGDSSVRRVGELLETAWRRFDDPLSQTADFLLEQLDEAVALLTPMIESEDAASERWFAARRRAEQHLAAALPDHARLILIDEGRWAQADRFAGHEVIPFPEESGRYAGPPLDDLAAIEALQRVRRRGATHLAIAEPAFWWLDHYGGFRDYLTERHRCLLNDDSVVVFDLTESRRVVTTPKTTDPEQTAIAFIVGCARSGTSILGEMIASHPQIHYLFEAHDAWKLAGSNDDDSDRLTADDVPQEMQQRIKRWFAQHRRDDTLLVEKNPRSVLRIPLIRSIFPEARLIHIVRDGRDVACSMIPGCGCDHWSHLRPPGWRQIMQQHAGAIRCAHAWLRVMQIAMGDLADAPHLQIRYEDLVADPQAAAQAVFDYLGMPVDAEVHAFCDQISNQTADSYHARHQSDWFRPDHDVRVGRWRQNLTNEDAQTINDLVAPMLQRLGYTP